MKNKDSGLNQALLDGIKTMISKGYSFEQIKKYLLEKNYPENTISQHYNYTNSKFNQLHKPNLKTLKHWFRLLTILEIWKQEVTLFSR